MPVYFEAVNVCSFNSWCRSQTEPILVSKAYGFVDRYQTQANRSIVPTGYKDAPQRRSIEPQTLELLVSTFNPAYREKSHY
jgi:hypothetical protein